MLRIGQIEVTAQNNKYTDGNVAGGIPATRLRAAALNAFQEELAGIVEGAGLTLDPEDFGQVLKALKRLFAAKTESLGALAALTGAKDKLPYFTGADAATLTDLTSVGRDILASATKTAVLEYLGLGEAAKRNVGTTENTVAAGDDPRIANAIQPKSPALITAFVNFSVSGGVVTINDSYNVSSVVRTATGRFNVIFTNAMKNSFYCPSVISRRPTAGTSEDGICYGLGSLNRVMSVNQFPVSINNAASTAEDPPFCCVTVSGGMS